MRNNGATIIKPKFGTGSLGVKLCKTNDELNSYFSMNQSRKAGYICEKYSLGILYSAEVTFSGSKFKVLGYNDRHLSAPPYFNETANSYPVELPNIINEKFNIFLNEYINESGKYNGIAHIEFLVKNSEIFVIEINPRIGGLYIANMMQNCHGNNPYKWAIEAILYNQLPSVDILGFASAKYLYAKKTGQLKRVDEGDYINSEFILHSCQRIPDNSIIESIGDFRSLVYQAYSFGTNPNIVFNSIQYAMNNVHLEIV